MEPTHVETPSFQKNVREEVEVLPVDDAPIKVKGEVEPVEQEELVDSHDDHADYFEVSWENRSQPFEKNSQNCIILDKCMELIYLRKTKRFIYDWPTCRARRNQIWTV